MIRCRRVDEGGEDMDIISAVKAAQDAGRTTIKRRWWHDGVIILSGIPMRINKPEVNPKRPYGWNPTVEDILADDWEVVVFDAKILND